MQRVNWKYLILSFFFFIILLTSPLYYHSFLILLKEIFEFQYLNLYAGGISLIFTVLQKIKTKKIVFSYNMSFSDFRSSVGDIISIIDTPITIVCCLTLARGLFFQELEGVVFFPYLKGYELIFVLLVVLYLLYVSMSELWKNIKDTCFDNKQKKDIE